MKTRFFFAALALSTVLFAGCAPQPTVQYRDNDVHVFHHNAPSQSTRTTRQRVIHSWATPVPTRRSLLGGIFSRRRRSSSSFTSSTPLPVAPSSSFSTSSRSTGIVERAPSSTSSSSFGSGSSSVSPTSKPSLKTRIKSIFSRRK